MTLEDIAWQLPPSSLSRRDGDGLCGLALILAMVGVFGILAYSVQQHVRDFGVRRALGATTNDVLRIVITNAAASSPPAPRSALRSPPCSAV